MYQLMGNDFTATIQALATAGKAQVLSRPSILARDGQQAEIVVGQSIYLPSGVSYSAVGNSATTVPTINGNYSNVGIQLDVTPFIGANSLVQMILEPSITSIDTSTPGQVIEGGSLVSSAVYAPNINKRSANTVVVTPDGQPVVIGGLIGSDKSSNDSKIPLLGDIPLLGQLFRFSAKSSTKSELLIFLTPHIVRAPERSRRHGGTRNQAVAAHHQFRFRTGAGPLPRPAAGEEIENCLSPPPRQTGAAHGIETPPKTRRRPARRRVAAGRRLAGAGAFERRRGRAVRPPQPLARDRRHAERRHARAAVFAARFFRNASIPSSRSSSTTAPTPWSSCFMSAC